VVKVWVLVLLLVSACGAVPVGSNPVANATPAPSPSAQQASPRPSPAHSPPPPSAVLAIVAGPKRSTISLVDSNGVVLASAAVNTAPLVANPYMSWTSASLIRLYFLNAGTEVRFLAPDGTSGSATRIVVAANEQAGFAVSPDDKRIAVSIFTYSPSFSGMRLYVEDLQGGGHHVDIFASPTAAEFPIGWTGGRLVLAVSTPDCCQTTPINPYGATTYHVVDPDTGNRLVTMCNLPGGPIEPVGVICFEYGPRTFEHWDGTPFLPPTAVQWFPGYFDALAPDGTRVAIGADPMRINGPQATDVRLDWVGRGNVFGWLDADRFVYQQDPGSPLRIYDDISESVTDISPVSSTYLGTFPPAIS
jgi:hypothetical protein